MTTLQDNRTKSDIKPGAKHRAKSPRIAVTAFFGYKVYQPTGTGEKVRYRTIPADFPADSPDSETCREKIL
jgi:hypothetical protein